MKKESTLKVLKDELQFVQKGGYRRSRCVWRAPLVFEDSPTCRKQGCSACSETDCALMKFVPTDCFSETAPCRHIPLNDLGETIDSLYRTATNEGIEQTLQRWLRQTIRQLAETSAQPLIEKAA